MRNLVNGSKRTKGYFFTDTAVGQQRGYLFRNDDRPPELTFRDLLENTPFYGESDAQALLDDASPDLFFKAGLTVLATDAQAIARQAKPSDRALSAQASQLSSAIQVNQDINTALSPYTGSNVIDVVRDAAITTRSEYQVKLADAFITWLQDTIDGIRTSVTVNSDAIALINDAGESGSLPDLQAQIDSLSSGTDSGFADQIPVGVELDWPSDTLPSGGKYLFEDGSTLSTTTYPDLYIVLGTTYGTEGMGSFKLPNPEGKIRVCRDVAQPEFAAIGNTGGAKTYTLVNGNLPPHTHEADTNGATINIISSGSHTHTFTIYGSAADGDYPKNAKNSGSTSSYDVTGGSHIHANTAFSGVVGNGPGTSTPFSILNPYIVGRKIIKALP
jgi:microcystin-dependent protein